MKEAIRFDPIKDEASSLLQRGEEHLAAAILDGGGSGRKTAEVMAAVQKLTGPLHHFKIQRSENVVDISSQKRREDVPIVDPVFVSFFEGVFLSMKVLFHTAESPNSDIPGQKAVQGSVKTFRIPTLFELKMGYLPQRMNACIGSPGTYHCDLFRTKNS